MAKIRKSDGEAVSPKEVLDGNWIEFNAGLSYLTEKQLKEAIDMELEGKNRPTYLTRLQRRYESRRATRERRQLKKKIAEVRQDG
jgi:hypothetical protein